jgi:hypothetical protein
MLPQTKSKQTYQSLKALRLKNTQTK